MSDEQAASAVKVTVYSAPWCGFCKMAKSYLTGKNVDFTDINIEEDRSAAMHIVEKTGQAGIPVIEIGNETILGFDRAAIDLALRSNKMVS